MDQPELNPSIIGVGIDLADVARIDSMLKKYGNAFLEKTFAGGQLRVTLQLQDHTVLTASRYGINTEVKEGQQIFCSFRPEDAVLVDREDAYE